MPKKIERKPLKSTDISGVFVALMPDENHGKLDNGDIVPLSVRVTYQGKRKYFSTGTKVDADVYDSLSSARDSRKDKKELLEFYDMMLAAVKSVRDVNHGYFSLDKLKDEVKSGGKERKDDAFAFWKSFGASKEKVKTRQMYDMALVRFREFYKGRKTLSLRDVTTSSIQEFDQWLMNQFCKDRKGNPTEKKLSLDSRMMIMRATRAVFNAAKENGLISVVPEFKVHVGNRRRTNAISVDDVLKLWNYWRSLDAKGRQSASGRAVGRWLMLYSLNGMNAIDMAKLTWQENSSVNEDYPQLAFIRSKIDRANKPVGRELDVTIIPIIPQLRELLDEYASAYQIGMPVFPDIFGNAATDEAKVIRVHDFNRRISKNIADVCDSLQIQRVTPQYARNSFISALAHHGVMASYIDYAVGHATSEVSALLAGYINNLSDEAMDAYNRKIFVVPPIPQN